MSTRAPHLPLTVEAAARSRRVADHFFIWYSSKHRRWSTQSHRPAGSLARTRGTWTYPWSDSHARLLGQRRQSPRKIPLRCFRPVTRGERRRRPLFRFPKLGDLNLVATKIS